MVFASIKALGFISTALKYPIFAYSDRFMKLFIDTSAIMRKRLEFFALAQHKVTTRLESESTRPDFISYILKHQGVGEKALTRGEIDTNAVVFLAAGSETTATVLSGATFLLLKEGNEAVYRRLVDEIRSAFTSAGEITVERVNKMPYLVACLQEAMRYYPPVPTGFPRVVPKGGDMISGHWIPEGVSKSIRTRNVDMSEVLTHRFRLLYTSLNTQRTTLPATTLTRTPSFLNAGSLPVTRSSQTTSTQLQTLSHSVLETVSARTLPTRKCASFSPKCFSHLIWSSWIRRRIGSVCRRRLRCGRRGL